MEHLKIPFTAGAPVSGEFFIDRESVVNEIINLINSSYGNILIYGKRRVGKTSLCLKLLEECESMKNTLASYMTMEANYDRTANQFTQAVILKIISSISFNLYKKKYSDLLIDLGKSDKTDGDYQQLLKIFELVRSENRKSAINEKSNIGFSSIIKAGIEINEGVNTSIEGLTSYELLELLTELVEFLNKKKIRKFILFVDEANKLAIEMNTRIIRENLSLFSAKGLQFCFVTTPEIIESVYEANELFQDKIELKGFENPNVIESLIEKYQELGNANKINFSKEAIDAIWKLSKGFPYIIQILCRDSAEKAIKENCHTVTVAHILEIVSNVNLV
jgi:AAA+ ATPase superfamily predicted ATPase